MSQPTSLDVAERPVTDPDPAPADSRAREIVVGADGSTTSLVAVRWAAREAAARQAPLRIVHAATYLGEPPSPGAAPPELPRARSIVATAYTAARHAAPGTTVSAEIVPEAPVPTLLRAAEDAQLLVLGISTTGAPDELVLASLTQRIAARSPRPVAVVPRSRSNDVAGRPVVAVVGMGDPADDRAVVRVAADAARRTDHPLALVDLRPRGARAPDSWEDEVRDLEPRTTELPHGGGVDLLRAVGRAPLLVVPTGHVARFHRVLDRQHRWLLRHCTRPMALVPPAA
jgi:nucleotide-binding universal stress UspA family protein